MRRVAAEPCGSGLRGPPCKGETGAINLYGPRLGLPAAISGMNSNWSAGLRRSAAADGHHPGIEARCSRRFFGSCTWASRLTNRYGIDNSTIGDHNDVFVCRNIRQPWPEFWKHFRYYG